KYTVRGRIEARVERRGADRLAIAIADTGPGFEPEELAEAFQPFKRIERTAAGLPGAGLGLSLSQRLVDLMGARLAADSAAGVGSCFTLELPFEPAALIDLGEPTTDGADALEGPLKVLVCEEDALGSAMLRTILEQLGHQVVHAHNGRRAVDLARAVGFDLVMLAARMPQMDAPDAIRAIRALSEPVGAVRIVALVGAEGSETGECMEAGADAAMRKPVSVGAVARAIAEAGAPRRRAA
ncbi:MAG: ATP-binding protein, partial [Caulobacteraceae bacterium]